MAGLGWISVALYLVVLILWLGFGYRVLTGRAPGRSAKLQFLLLTLIVAGLTWVQVGQFAQ